jgi:hypothetical protein
MREVFRQPRHRPEELLTDVYYTITKDDVGTSSIPLQNGNVIPVGEVIGRITKKDIGRILVATLSQDGTRTMWRLARQ